MEYLILIPFVVSIMLAVKYNMVKDPKQKENLALINSLFSVFLVVLGAIIGNFIVIIAYLVGAVVWFKIFKVHESNNDILNDI